MGANILVVDDESVLRRFLSAALEAKGYTVTTSSNGEDALDLIRQNPYDVVISDVVMPGINGLELVSAAKEINPRCDVVLITAYASVDRAADAMERGAADFVMKPLQVDQIHFVIQRVLAQRRLRDLNSARFDQGIVEHTFCGMVGMSLSMQSLFEQIRSIASVPSTVLIQGESGTGKELVARAIVETATVNDDPFVPVNCAALSEHLLESELFGYVRGAFTGATTNKDGLFRIANNGTIFLDEIGDISPALQLRLLRIIQEREYRPVGGTEAVKVSVRVMAATNVDLKQRTAQGLFREDLFYRLNVIPLDVPPLRERREDIPLLSNYFMRRFEQQYHKRFDGIESGAMNLLMGYDWPGNVRELENVISRATAFVKGGEIKPTHLPDELVAAAQGPQTQPALQGTLREVTLRAEREAIVAALRQTQGAKEVAAKLLGINRTTLWKKMRAHHIAEDEFGGEGQ